MTALAIATKIPDENLGKPSPPSCRQTNSKLTWNMAKQPNTTLTSYMAQRRQIER
jgi:hypothetical protein